jgi:AraC-like DNA-binding protein
MMSRQLENHKNESNLKEKAVHGSTLFPLERYTTVLSPLSPEFSVHWHPEMEFTKIKSGQAIYTIDLQEYHAVQGDIICIPPGLLHTGKIPFQGSMVSDSFVFHLNLLGSSSADICTLLYFSPLMNGSLLLPHVITPKDSCYLNMEQTFSSLSDVHTKKQPGYELEIKSLLFHLVQLVISHPNTRQKEGESIGSQRLKLVFDFIHEHYAEDIRIEDLARLCCISPSRFMHFFREACGTTFNQYLNQYRIRQSALLLRQGNEISQAAYACGFNNLPYFYKRFQEYYHMTPKAFQKIPEIR